MVGRKTDTKQTLLLVGLLAGCAAPQKAPAQSWVGRQFVEWTKERGLPDKQLSEGDVTTYQYDTCVSVVVRGGVAVPVCTSELLVVKDGQIVRLEKR